MTYHKERPVCGKILYGLTCPLSAEAQQQAPQQARQQTPQQAQQQAPQQSPAAKLQG